ncbi:MAG TPA: TfoX/Sxy family protein [Gemmatimonadales bacterium]|nr:TfoX/Sxy family protein [Gemmatimonadales bacterium]
MTVSGGFRSFVLEQLGRVVRDVRGRSMFGGVGIYSGDVFFALIADDTLYFKVDDSTRPDFESRNMDPFRPYGPDGEVMQYYCVPAEVLEDAEALADWAERAIAVARRARKRPPRR